MTSGLPASVELSALPDRIASGGGQAVITATVRDEGASLVADGLPVSFTTTLGTLNPESAATAAGRAATVLTSGVISGTAWVTAEAAGITTTIPVGIVGAGEPFALALEAAPEAIRVDGPAAVLTATVTDGVGDPVANGTAVHFETDRGVLAQTDVTTSGGKAHTQLLPGTAPGQARVTASAGNAYGEMQVTILAGLAATVTLAANPTELVAGYNQFSLLQAGAVDRYGNPVADGTAMSFTASLGQVSPPSVTTLGGVGEAHLIGGLVAGTSSITVTAQGGAAGHAQVRIRPAVAASLTLSLQPAEIQVGGEAARLTVRVRDQYGNAAEDGTAVELTTDLGDLRPAAARLREQGENGLAAASLVVTTTQGSATAELVSGHSAGAAHLRASAAPGLLATATVTIRPGPPQSVTLAIQPAQVRPGGRVQLAATVLDQFGNAAADGTTVQFFASRGQLDANQVLTHGGVAANWLTAPFQPGSITVFVNCGSASTFGSLEVVALRTYLPLIVKRLQ